jgi:hypothetical protein
MQNAKTFREKYLARIKILIVVEVLESVEHLNFPDYVLYLDCDEEKKNKLYKFQNLGVITRQIQIL